MNQLLNIALRGLSANRLRAVLTMFGVVWGIATVIILVAVINGFRISNEKMFQDMGIDLLVMEYSRFYIKEGTRYPLTFDEEDAKFIQANHPEIEFSAPQLEEWREMQVGDKKEWFGINATTPEMKDIRGYILEAGRFITLVDEENSSKVIVIGARVKEEFFGESGKPVLGSLIAISGKHFQIVGILAERAGFSDWAVIMPISTYKNSLAQLGHGGGWGNRVIYAKLKQQSSYEKTREEIRSMLSARHGFEADDDMAIRFRDFQERRAEANKMLIILFLITYLIGLITLAIGAVGVMNIMLVNVRERVREIGLRKAIGATIFSITAQFLAEALLLMMIGGLIGIVFGTFVVGILRQIPMPEGFPTPIVTIPTIYSALIVNILVGAIAGAYPAYVAASLDPILALRSE